MAGSIRAGEIGLVGSISITADSDPTVTSGVDIEIKKTTGQSIVIAEDKVEEANGFMVSATDPATRKLLKDNAGIPTSISWTEQDGTTNSSDNAVYSAGDYKPKEGTMELIFYPLGDGWQVS
jgi:hypothetical protein